MIVLGSDGSTARLQIFPDPRPGSGPVSENPDGAAETGPLSTANPARSEMANRAAPSERLRRRLGRVAGEQELVVW
jgi:hypothetical protein